MKIDDSTINEKLSQAIQNHKNNNLIDAEKTYKEVLEKDSNNPKAIFNLGTLYAQSKKFQLAKPLLFEADKLIPNNYEINLNLGNLFFETGEFDTALPYYDKALELKPNLLSALFNKGIILNNFNKNQDAINCFEKVLEIKPQNVITLNILAQLLLRVYKYEKAILNIQKSLSIDAENIFTINILAQILKSVQFENVTDGNSEDLTKLFILLYKKNSVDQNELFNNAKKLIFTLKDQKEIQKLLDTNSNLLENTLIKKILKKKLFHLVLQKSLCRDVWIEKLLCKIRNDLLISLDNSVLNNNTENIDFIISYAEQSNLNEYIIFQNNKEIQLVNNLKEKIENDKTINELEIAILACYVPINKSKTISEKLSNYTSKNNLFNELIKISLHEPLKEREIKNSIKSFGVITDAISKKVRDQYEENPYPRWRNANKSLNMNFLNVLNNDIFPNKINSNINLDNAEILIAGCGTGQQLAYRKFYENSNITAVDLSLSSLAYAKRKTQELGHKNINFLHSDLINLKNLNKKFMIIECMGVLHHMKNPEEGLKVLVDMLEPNGFLKIGLYSNLARKHIVEAREFIKKNNFQNNVDDIRNCRNIIMNNNNESLKKLTKNYDFYSTSNIRDLIFHVNEHRYNLIQISDLLAKNKLEFLGFNNSNIKNNYSKKYPDDKTNTKLENWNEYEKNNIDAFIGMYQFWVKKIDYV